MKILASAISSILRANTTKELLGEYDGLFDAPIPTPVFGVQKQPGVSIERARRDANQAALDVLARVGTDHTKLTEDDKTALRKYSGLGGIGGSIHEYYTPQFVAEGIWDAVEAMGVGPGNYLEPSAGTGVFHGAKPQGVIMTATEIDPVSSQINQLLHPEDQVVNSPFEKLATSAEDNTWDGVVGNVPFGETRGSYGALDPEYSHIKYVDQYFVSRMVDKVRAGALICVVVPMRIVSRASWSKWRRELSLKAEFLGAHRLPSGTFSNNGTDTATDVLVMRKHPEDLAALVNERKTADLEAANVLWDTWIKGKWFESAEGRKFIHGTQSTVGEGKFAREVVDGGDLDSAAIKARLAHKFDSRIDWMAIELAEPQILTHAEGDERLMNGRWHQLVNGVWQVVSLTASDGDSIDQAVYGVGSLRQLTSMIRQSPSNALELTYPQLMAVARDFPRAVEGTLSLAIRFANGHDEKYRERLIRGSIIGERIRDLSAMQERSGTFPTAEAAELRQLINQEVARFGVAAADRRIASLRGGNAGPWNAFVAGTDVNGRLSDLLMGQLDIGNAQAYDPTNAEQVVAHLFGQMDLNPVDVTDFARYYKGQVPPSLAELAKLPGIAITPDGMLAPLDRATTGDIVKKSQRLMNAMATTSDPGILENYQSQLDLIEKKRKRTGVDDIEMTMASKWLPRRYVLEFLRENGYSEITYTKIVNEDGELVEVEDYEGADGVFGGYTMRDGKKRSNPNEKLERQLENYLNGVGARSNTKEGSAVYRDQIRNMETDFGTWLRQHDDIEALTNRYNDTFNGFIPIEHSDAELGLDGVAGEIIPFGYQNQAVRRLSEDGRGALGFGTGLGKTTTALSLVAYNTQLGRARRSGIVVPKAVLENWYHETIAVLGRDYLDNCLFVGLEPVRGKDGEIEQVPVLDDQGEPKLGRNGQPLMRDRTRELDGKAVTERLNLIPHTNKTMVVMTKEQYARIPMRPESIVEHVDRMLEAGLQSNKITAEAANYREAMKKEKFKEKHSDTGTAKDTDVPYFEDMGFDSVVVDEAHNYRNTYEPGREAAQIAFLPKPKSADSAIDMQMKNAWLLRKHKGRGPILLTATPTVNSPCDIFNMLNHVMTMDEWQQFGISDIDDFIRVFGETAECQVQKLSGEIEAKQGLVGFKNLSGLRGIFHKFVNLKNAKDVSATVTIPDLIEEQVESAMTPEQEAIYEELRTRAEELNSEKEQGDESTGPADSVFAIIADMERVCTDLDLYHKTMTFTFPVAHKGAVEKLVAALPESLSRKVKATATNRDDDEEISDGDNKNVTITTFHNAKITVEGGAVRLVVADLFEDEVVSRLAKFGIPANVVSHPVMPKYARLLANLKASYEQGGKQLVFVEDKRQHNKLRRLISHHLGIDQSEIGIINAGTADGKSDFTDAAGKKLKGVEPLAAAYNEGRFRILICNKKAEVGVNLHHGTTDIHHLTLPWTPASIKQRNGRGARVGAKQASVRVWYYLGRGSFDEWRLAALKKKAEWQQEILTKDGVERAKNADADDGEEAGILLARDPEERRAKIAETQRIAEKRIREAAIKRGNINLHNYLKASHDVGADKASIQSALDKVEADFASNQSDLRRVDDAMAKYHDLVAAGGEMTSYYQGLLKEKSRQKATLVADSKTLRGRRFTLSRRLERVGQAADLKKRLRPELERAIKAGLVSAPLDVLDHGSQYLSDGVRTVRVGGLYDGIGGTVLEVVSVDFESKRTMARVVYSQRNASHIDKVTGWGLDSYLQETSRSPSEIELLRQLATPKSPAAAAALLDAGQFSEYLADGTLQLNLDYYLTHSNDGFSGEYQASYQGAPKRLDMSTVVYPSTSNASLKAKLAKWLLGNRSMLDNSSYRPWWSAIFGDDVTAAVESYGAKAPEQVINEWVSASLEAYRQSSDGIKQLEKSLAGGYSLYSYYFEAFAMKRMPGEWDNLGDFKAACKLGVKTLEREVEESIAAGKARESEALRARYQLAKANGDEGRRQRLEWLAKQNRSHNAYSGARDVRSASYGDEAPYASKDGSFDLPMAVADLVAIGATLPPNLDSDALDRELVKVFDHAFYELVSPRSTVLQEWIERNEPKPAPEPEAVAKAEKVIAATEQPEHQDGAPGITFRVNTAPVTIRISKYKRQDFEAGDMLGLHDPEGKSGTLFASKETLKALFSAKFSTDASTEYPGAWWFVPASTDHDRLKSIMSGASN